MHRSLAAAAQYNIEIPAISRHIRDKLLEEHLHHCRQTLRVQLAEWGDLMSQWRDRYRVSSDFLYVIIPFFASFDVSFFLFSFVCLCVCAPPVLTQEGSCIGLWNVRAWP